MTRKTKNLAVNGGVAVNEEEKRLQLQRDEMNRQMQRDEMNRQMQRDEMNRQMQRDEMNRHEAQRLLEADVRKKEAANRCVNNDGPAVMVGLCVGCYVNMRAAEARTNRRFDKAMVTEILRDVDDATKQPERRPSADRLDPRESGQRSPGAPGQPTAGAASLAMQYARNFDKTPQLLRLWEQAMQEAGAVGGANFERVRAEFWRIVNTDTGPDADYVRRLLKAAGFALSREDNAPMLIQQWQDERKGRYDNARRLSIDHEVPRSKDIRRAVDATNLRFMLMDDNLRRGAKYGADEVPFDAERAAFHRQAEAVRAVEADRRKRESANRCANNDGPAIMGGLCIACFATMRAAEAKDSGENLKGRIYGLIAKQARKRQ